MLETILFRVPQILIEEKNLGTADEMFVIDKQGDDDADAAPVPSMTLLFEAFCQV